MEKSKDFFFAREQNILLAAQMYHQWLSADKWILIIRQRTAHGPNIILFLDINN